MKMDASKRKAVLIYCDNNVVMVYMFVSNEYSLFLLVQLRKLIEKV